MTSNEYKPTHGGYPPQKSRPGSRSFAFQRQDDGSYKVVHGVFVGCPQWTPEKIMEARLNNPLYCYDAAIAQFATLAKVRP